MASSTRPTGHWGWLDLIRRAHRAFSLPVADVVIVVEAGVCLLVSRLALAMLPFRTVVWLASGSPEEPSEAGGTVEHRRAKRVAWAIEAAALRTPIPLPCLPQALAARVMLRRRGIGSVLHLGARLCNGGLHAHAWLVAGPVNITGVREAESFRPVATIR